LLHSSGVHRGRIPPDLCKEREGDRDRERQSRHIDRDRQTDNFVGRRETERQRQTNRETDRETERERERKRELQKLELELGNFNTQGQ